MSTTETALLFFGYSLICLVVLGFAARLAIKRRDLPGFVCTVRARGPLAATRRGMRTHRHHCPRVASGQFSHRRVSLLVATCRTAFPAQPIGCLTLVVENLFLGIEFVAGTPEDVATLTSIRFIVHCEWERVLLLAAVCVARMRWLGTLAVGTHRDLQPRTLACASPGCAAVHHRVLRARVPSSQEARRQLLLHSV